MSRARQRWWAAGGAWALVGGLAWGGCAASAKRSPGVPSPSPEGGAEPDAGGRGPAPSDELGRLGEQLRQAARELEGIRGEAEAAAVEGAAASDAPTAVPGEDRAGDRCERIRALAERICELRERVCRLSVEHAGAPRYADACAAAEPMCADAERAADACTPES